MNEIKVIRDHRDLRIYIDNHLHFHLILKNYVGMQSWLEDSKKAMYCIEIYTTDTTILLEYDNVDTWTKILKLFDENI